MKGFEGLHYKVLFVMNCSYVIYDTKKNPYFKVFDMFMYVESSTVDGLILCLLSVVKHP